MRTCMCVYVHICVYVYVYECVCVCMCVYKYVCVLTSSRVDFSISSKGSRASTCSTLACANKITNYVFNYIFMYVMYIKTMYCMYVCIYINNLHKHHDKHTNLRGRLLSLWSGLSVLRFDNRRQRAHAVPRQNGRQYRLTIHSHGPIHTCQQVKIFTEYMMNTYIHTYILAHISASNQKILHLTHTYIKRLSEKKEKKRV